MILPGPQTGPQDDGDGKSHSYHIDFQRLIELKRSPGFMLASRLDPDLPYSPQGEQDADALQKVVEQIADRSTGERGFIQPEMPIQEIVFRVMLLRRNQPIPLRELHQEVTERWATPVRPISLSQKGLKRVLEADTYYGFAEAES